MAETLTDEPPIGSTIELTGDNPQAGWRYHRTEHGWVRVFSDGCLDAGHPLDWRFAGWCVLTHGPHYRDRGHEAHHEGPLGFHHPPDGRSELT